MNWRHTKTVLILLLAAVNILLLGYAKSFYQQNNFTVPENARLASEILKKDGIFVGDELLSTKNDSPEVLICEYDREEYFASASALLFGGERDSMYILPNGVRAVSESGESAFFGYDMSLSYISREIADKKDEVSKNARPVGYDRLKTECRQLEDILALPKNSLSGSNGWQSGEYTFVNTLQSEDGISLFEMECIFGIRDGKIVYAGGRHLFAVPTQSRSTPIFNRLNIMFSEKERSMRGTVTDISLCYTLYENAETENVLLIPSYAVTYSTGTVHAVNALSKELY